MKTVTYHPDPEINAHVANEMLASEIANLEAGMPPSPWTCPTCATTHSRGHLGAIGVHRCLKCGYIGPDGIMGYEGEFDSMHAEARAEFHAQP